jgi:hypothetical protein
MSQPVKLSDEIMLEARNVAKLAERSIAGQIEFWARLGCAIEPLLTSQKAHALKEGSERKKLSLLFATIDQPEGAKRLSAYLSEQPFPHYQVSEENPGMLVRIDESGVRTVGRFVNRIFVPAAPAQGKKVSNKSSRGRVAANKKVNRQKGSTG